MNTQLNVKIRLVAAMILTAFMLATMVWSTAFAALAVAPSMASIDHPHGDWYRYTIWTDELRDVSAKASPILTGMDLYRFYDDISVFNNADSAKLRFAQKFVGSSIDAYLFYNSISVVNNADPADLR